MENEESKNIKPNRDGNYEILIEFSINTIITLIIFIVLAIFGRKIRYKVGLMFLCSLCFRNKCKCPICKEEYVIEGPLTAGGFGEVNQ